MPTDTVDTVYTLTCTDSLYTLTWERMPACALSDRALRLCLIGAVSFDDTATDFLALEEHELNRFGPYKDGSWDGMEEWLRTTSTDIPDVWFTMLVQRVDGDSLAFHALNGNVEQVKAEIKIAPPSWATKESAGE